eukprot:g5002.t1
MPSSHPAYVYPPIVHNQAFSSSYEYCDDDSRYYQHIVGGYKQDFAKAPWDMNSLKAAIRNAEAGTGEIANIISSCSFKPREPAFTKIISMCGRWKSSEKAFEVFQAMIERRGVQPNAITYTALVAACSVAEDYNTAMKVYNEMKNAAITDPECQPNEVTFNKIITASEENGNYAFAINCFHETETKGVEVDRAVYYSVLNSCLKTESWKEAERVLSIIHGKGFAATLENYSVMIDHYGERGAAQTAMDLFIKMQELNQCVDEHCCHALMKAFERVNSLEMVVELLNCMWEEGIRVKMSTYVSALRVFASRGQWKPSLTILKRMVHDYDTIPEEAKALILRTTKESNETEIAKTLENLFSKEASDRDASSSFST